jgi:ketosteroid isomerase-like protein
VVSSAPFELPPKDFRAVTAQLRQAATDVSDSQRMANVEAVRAQIDAIGRGDYQAALANADPEVQLEIFAPPEFPWIRQSRGVEGLLAALAHNFGSVENQTPTIHNVITQADTVVLFGDERGVIRATGATYKVQFVHRFTFAGGRLINVRIVAARNDVK